MKIARVVRVAVCAVLSACGGAAHKPIASVQLQVTSTNPRVGDTSHVGATPVDAGGLTVQGVQCGFASSNPAIATVDPANGTVTALSPGVTTITAQCDDKQATVAITVRPKEVTLTLQKQGAGGGALFASPAGTPNFEPGTSVTITATPNQGSAFTAWGGACAATAAPAACTLTLNADTTVIATFDLSETFVSGTWSASLGSVTDNLGCQYSVSASGVLTLGVVEKSGSVTGSSSTTAHIGIVNTHAPPYTSCTALPFDTSGAGSLSGSDAALTSSLASSGGSFTMTYNGTRSGTTISGSATVHQTLKDANGTTYPTSGTTATFSATKQ